ncbi:hypothetical protein [Brevundimonas diminuta]|uniref:hypothetical protein n=1 Tax=Brevundimonas diminuta TaxID=293 RepID=UPI0018DF9A73|nr:hypothetical protein [Brevundimonas diminuta]
MAMQLPHYLRAPEEWPPENVTARDLVVWRDIVVSAFCEGCRVSREMNVWRIGAPTPIRRQASSGRSPAE